MLDTIPAISKGSVPLKSNLKLLCYTDGLVELLEGEDISLATSLLEKEISNQESLEKNVASIISCQSIEEGNSAIFDDITMLGIEFL